LTENIIAFSLYGTKRLYNLGMLLNSVLYPIIYQGWKVIIFHDNTVRQEVLEELSQKNAILKNMTSLKWIEGWSRCWRFLAADPDELPDFGNYYLSRDSDSRPSLREKWAVDHWMNQGRTLCSIRDSLSHNIPIMGGMHGLKRTFRGMRSLIQQYHDLPLSPHQVGYDQDFLNRIIWPKVQDSVLFYGNYQGIPIPIPIERSHIGAPDGPTPEEVKYYGWEKISEALDD
jgi:hypothetical protein